MANQTKSTPFSEVLQSFYPPRESGIYRIYCVLSGASYIGSAVNLRSRMTRHIKSLGKGTHHNAYMQNIWNARGAGSFCCEVVLFCDKKDLIQYEQIVMDATIPAMNGTKIAGSFAGMKMSEEGRRKISEANKGKPKTAEHRKNLSVAKMGRALTGITEEVIRKRAEASCGRRLSQATKDKLSAARKGKSLPKFTAEHKQRIADALRGRRRDLARFKIHVGGEVFCGFSDAADRFGKGQSTIKYWAKIGHVPSGNGHISGGCVTVVKNA